MKLPLPSLPALLTFLFFLSMLVKLAVTSLKTRKLARNLPPGPWPLPFIGNVNQLLGTVAHRALRDLSMKYGPLMHLKLGEVPTIIVSSPDTAKQILKTHDMTFFQRPYVLAHEILSYNRSNIMIAPYGNYWRQMRKICTIELLGAKRVQSFRSILEEEVSNLVKDIPFSSSDTELGMPINLTEKIFSLIYGITSRAAFGNKYCKDQEAFITTIKEVVKVAGGLCFADMYPSSQVLKFISGMRHKLEKLHRAADGILGNIVNEHRKARNYGAIKSSCGEQGDQEDLVDVLLKLQEHGDLEFPLTDDNIKAVILQKIVINVPNCKKYRTKALKIAAVEDGVTSVALHGPQKDQLMIIEEIDAACLISSLRKKLCHASLETVEVKEIKKEPPKPPTPNPVICYCQQQPQVEYYRVVADPSPGPCTIM